MKQKGVKIEEAQDRRMWRLKLDVPTPNGEKAKGVDSQFKKVIFKKSC